MHKILIYINNQNRNEIISRSRKSDPRKSEENAYITCEEETVVSILRRKDGETKNNKTPTHAITYPSSV